MGRIKIPDSISIILRITYTYFTKPLTIKQNKARNIQMTKHSTTKNEPSDIRYPKAVVFDLDYTLWSCWCDTHIRGQIKLIPNTQRPTVQDRSGFEVSLFPDVVDILTHLNSKNVRIFSASRTANPPMAKKLIKLLQIEHLIEDSEWGWGTKTQHLNVLSKRNNVELHEMCLFDDEYRNKDVEKIGVKFCYLPDQELNWGLFWEGLKGWKEFNEKKGTLANIEGEYEDESDEF